MADKVLIVDDDPAICKMLSKVMDSNDLESDIANSGTEALNFIEKHNYEAILMDVMMDDMEGFDDDYITKPFRPLIVGAKVKALIRRNKNQMNTTKDIIVCGDLKYDTTSLRFYKNNEEIELSSKENNLIFLFMKHPDQVFTKEMIYEHVWGNSIVVDDNTIMVYINRLRNKIEDNPQKPVHILTVRGVGYRFHA